MRIAGGEWCGRTLKVPPGDAVRPTQDRVRGALFSMIQAEIAGASFLDLFAGAGVCYEDGDLVDRDVVDGGFGAVFRLGATAWLGPLSVTGEYLINPDNKELVGDVGLHLSENFSLHVYVDQIDFDDFDLRDDTVFGGGMTFSF